MSVFTDDDFATDTVDESTAPDLSGTSSRLNQVKGMSMGGSPTRSLVMLWFIALGLYWLTGFLFRRVRG